MTSLRVEFPGGSAAKRPGETLEGEAAWTLSEPAASLTLELAWTTEGQGTGGDPVVVETRTFEAPATEGAQHFQFTLPAGPWSFEGTLIKVVWFVELRESVGRQERQEFVLSPSGAPLRTMVPDLQSPPGPV